MAPELRGWFERVERVNPSVRLERTAEILAPAKINLSLRIKGLRADGFHLLDSVLVPVSVFDRLRVTVSPATDALVELVCRPPVCDDHGSNLAARAADVFLRRVQKNARVRLDLTKDIPVGAGMGGGSSDAAAVLRVLRVFLAPRLSDRRLRDWGLELGADVPFFLFGQPARMGGIGERLRPVSHWPSAPLLIAFAGEGLSTAQVYRAFDATLTTPRSGSTKTRFTSSLGTPTRDLLVNDLEAAAFHVQPRLPTLKRRLFELGAHGALMTGSGGAIFGFWDSGDRAERAAVKLRAEGIWARVVEILSRVPGVVVEGTANDGR